MIASMAEYLVELYLPRSRGDDLAAAAPRARAAAEQLTRQGTVVRYLRTIFVPEDETCFYLFEAESAEAVGNAARRASISFERVLEVVSAA